MATNQSELIRCANPACACEIEPHLNVCSEYCASVDGWADEVQTEVCGCGHPDCKPAPHQHVQGF